MDQYSKTDGKPDLEGTLYGESIAYGQEFRAPGYVFTDQLAVFAMIEGTYLKLVGIHLEGKYVGRGWDDSITLETVKKAWEQPTGTAGNNYQVKAVHSTSTGRCSTARADFQGIMYGPWIPGGYRAPGFNLSDELTVFAVKHDGYLKMAGLRRETKYQKGHDGASITLDVVKQAWESLTARKITYHVKDAEACIKYNDCLHLVNQYDPANGYLGTRNHSGRGGYGVETTNTGNRDNHSGTWQITSKRGENGTVFYGDLVHFVNQYDPSNGYLYAYGHSCRGGYEVETCGTENRDKQSGTWRIVSASGKCGAVLQGDIVHLVNQYDPPNGYLDTHSWTQHGGRGIETTNTGNRDNGSGTWMIGKGCFGPTDARKSSDLIQI